MVNTIRQASFHYCWPQTISKIMVCVCVCLSRTVPLEFVEFVEFGGKVGIFFALLLSNLRNICRVWHAMGYSGRCGQDELGDDAIHILRSWGFLRIKGCQINIPCKPTWENINISLTFGHLGWPWYWSSFPATLDGGMADSCQDGPFASDDMAISDAWNA